jgi:hypothetical protein
MTAPVLRGIFTAISIGLGSCIGLFSDQTDPPNDPSLCAQANVKVNACFPGALSGLPNDPSLCTGPVNCQAVCFQDASCEDIMSLFQGGCGNSLCDCTSNCF